MEDQGREYRYQKDWSVGGEMFHVRCDVWEDFLQAVKNMQNLVPKAHAFPEDTGATATPETKVTDAPIC